MNTRIPSLLGVSQMEIHQQILCRVFQILKRFPCSFLWWVTFPKYQVLHSFAALIHPTLSNGFDDVVTLTFNLFDWRRRLVTTIRLRLTVWFKF